MHERQAVEVLEAVEALEKAPRDVSVDVETDRPAVEGITWNVADASRGAPACWSWAPSRATGTRA
jgi:hypothetical protein